MLTFKHKSNFFFEQLPSYENGYLDVGKVIKYIMNNMEILMASQFCFCMVVQGLDFLVLIKVFLTQRFLE